MKYWILWVDGRPHIYAKSHFGKGWYHLYKAAEGRVDPIKAPKVPHIARATVYDKIEATDDFFLEYTMYLAG